jgi:hypothetical protein
MNAFIGRLLVLFYVITIPLFLGLYLTSMFSAHPKYDALWIEGGVTEFGPAAFLVLVAVFIFPLIVCIGHYLFWDSFSYLEKVLKISAWMAPWPIACAIVARKGRTDFPLAITMMDDGLCFCAIGCVIGVGYSVYTMYATLSLDDAQNKKVESLSSRYGASKADVIEVMARLINNWNGYKVGSRHSTDHYVMLHLRLFSNFRSSVEEYWTFVERAIGVNNFFRDEALDELERHLKLCPEFGGVEPYFHWLEELRRFELYDKSLKYYYHSGTYHFGEVSLPQVLIDYRIGEFTSATEYLEFLKARPPSYVSTAEREKYQAEADKMTHPVLHRMLELGGFYRARALQIAQRSSSHEIPVSKVAQVPIPSPVVVAPPAVTSPSIQSVVVMISRGGQIIFNDVKMQNLSNMVMQGQVLMTDHYWCSGMAGWALVSSYRSTEVSRDTPKPGVNWDEVLKDFFLSWLLYVLGGIFIAGLIGYGNGGMSGAGSAIGGFLGFIILVRPVTFLFRTLFRLATGKRGMELF